MGDEGGSEAMFGEGEGGGPAAGVGVGGEGERRSLGPLFEALAQARLRVEADEALAAQLVWSDGGMR